MVRKILASLALAILCGVAVNAQSAAEPTIQPAAAQAAPPENDRYRIGYQDVLNVQVYRHPDMNETVPVSTAGTIKLFRIDRPIVAVCHTEEELQSVIEKAYGEKHLRNPKIRVSVAEQKSQPIAIVGAVEKPQTYYVNRKVHLLEMLALAGGTNKEAGTRIVVARTGSAANCRQESNQEPDDVAFFNLKVRDIREGKTTFWLKPGDVVSVLDADNIYVYGNVNRQGAFKIRDAVTLRQALVIAEGLKPAARKEKIRVLRSRDGSQDREELVFNLNDIDKGKIKDPYLLPDDIVAVSEDGVKSILLGLANAVKGAAPNVIYRLPMP